MNRWHVGTIKCLTQEGRELDMRKLRQSHNYKATPIPGFFRGQVLKNSADKVFLAFGFLFSAVYHIVHSNTQIHQTFHAKLP